MRRPKADRYDLFLRRTGSGIDVAAFNRGDDGSALVLRPEAGRPVWSADIHEGHGSAWEQALQALAAEGFVSRREAIVAGLVGEDWQPPTELARLIR